MGRKRAQAPAAPGRRKLNLSVAPEFHRRIGAYASWRGEDVSAVMVRAAEAEMRQARFVIYTGDRDANGRGGGQSPAAEGEGTGQAEVR